MRGQDTKRGTSHRSRSQNARRTSLFLAATLAMAMAAHAQPVPVADTGTVTADDCNSNGIIDPNETVIVSLGILNTGTTDTVDLLATLLPTGGVTLPGGPQSYGVVVAGGATVVRSFSFTSANVACGSTLTATLALQDGATSLGTITYDFQTGNLSAAATNPSTGDIAVPIVDSGVVDIPLTVTEVMSLGDVNVSFRLDHTFDADLDISLVHPDNTVVPLVFDRGSNGDNFGTGANDCSGAGTELDDQAATAISAGAAPFAGVFRPESPLSVLNGKPSSGVWRLRVSDDLAGFAGTVGCFKLQLRRATCCGAISAAAPVTVTAESAFPQNNAPDPGETLTVMLPLLNSGDDTANLVATLQATGGVTNPSGPQNYGVVLGGGPAVARPFTFTVAGTCGGLVTLTLTLQDGALGMGTITYTLQSGTVVGTQTFANTTPIVIPAGAPAIDEGPAAPYPSDIIVSGMSGSIASVRVMLKLFSHTFPSDVDVLLVSPTGQKLIIMSDFGGGTDAVNVNVVLDDAAATTLPAAIVSGTFRPGNNGANDLFVPPAPAAPHLNAAPAGTDTLRSAFAGQDPNGTWSLYVVDDAGVDVGNFNGGWEISITTVVCANPSPVAGNDGFVTSEDTPLVVLAPGLLANDADPNGDPMTIAILTAPLHGVISSVNTLTGAFTYTPNADYNGPDSFTYQLSDGTGVGNVATVFIVVNPVNDPPVANPDSYSVDEDGTLTVPALTGVLANDGDVDLNPLTAVLDSIPANFAAFSFSGTGAFSYTPAAHFNGVDSFTYHATDGLLDSATVTVAITVDSVNDVPSFTKGPNQHVVGGAPATVANWATAISAGPPNESGQTLTFLVTADRPELFTSQPAVSPDGTLNFDPAPNANGVATVTVRVQDSGGTANGGVDTSAPQTFTILVVDIIVNYANDIDDGVCNATHCSLREALAFANFAPNLGPGQRDTVSFAIPGAGSHVIPILSPLPPVAEPVVIDGTTQPGYALTPLVELNGTSAGLGVAGLRLGAGQSDVTGLAINRFEGHGIEITGPGTNSIFTNFIGTDPTGLLPRPNGGSGIRISGSPSNLIRANVLSGNGRAGLRLEAGADSNLVIDNLIGVGFDGTSAVPNAENGVFVLSSSSNSIATNVIAQNNTQGVQVSSGLHNTIRANQIHANGLLGIELGADGVTPNDVSDADGGANGLQNYPVLTRVTTSPTTTGISGTFAGAANTVLVIDYYVSDTCDTSGNGEGATALDNQTVTTNGSGQAVIQVSSGFAATTAGQYLTATATSPLGDTSEFSACRRIDPLPTLTLTGGEVAGVLQINEGNPTMGPPTQALTFFAQLSAASALPVTVAYQTTDGTAQSPSDFLGTSGTLVFGPGETVKQIVVQTVLDADPETDESFTLSLGVPSNAAMGQSQIQIVLKDDDGSAGPLALSVADIGVSEPRTGVRTATFVVSLSDPSFHTVWVDFHTTDGTATQGLDFLSVPGQLVFQPGDVAKTVSVDIRADALREVTETFFLVLTNPQGAILGRGQGTATVADPGSLFTVKPCRLYDSRQASVFVAGELRTLTLTGSCGVPDTAIAISANITVTQPTAPGFIEVFPSDRIAPATSVLNFTSGQTRANNAVVTLSAAGQATFKNVANGTTHVIVDVSGYFE